jgi:hypothetical protein
LSQPGTASGPSPQAKLVMSALFCDVGLEGELIRALEGEFGGVDLVSERLPFDHTRYYEREMGRPLHRRVLSFRDLVTADSLVEAKLKAQALEARFGRPGGQRRVNLDPALLGLHNFILATHKGYAHRIYLGKGVYGDLALIYRDGGFRPLEWTYPDYASAPMVDLLDQIRAVLVWQRRGSRGGKRDAP